MHIFKALALPSFHADLEKAMTGALKEIEKISLSHLNAPTESTIYRIYHLSVAVRVVAAQKWATSHSL